MKTVVFTGGGSGGHVIPAITLIKKLLSKEYENLNIKIYYIGSYNGVERDLINKIPIKYYKVHTGKLRRYFSIQNFTDIFRLFLGFVQSLFILFKNAKGEKILFSTGGFVSVPVVIAGKLLGYKVFVHEQTSRAGLANKICSYFSTKVFVSFKDSMKFFPINKTFYSGYPLRDECFFKNIESHIFKGIDLSLVKRPILFVTGGGNGSQLINQYILDNLDFLKENYFTIHQVGKNFIGEFESLRSETYFPVSLVGDEMIDLYKISNIILSRAGAGTVSELVALKKKSIFIPLKIAQKNEQYHNAKYAKDCLGSLIVEEDDLNGNPLEELFARLHNKKVIYLEFSEDVCLNGTITLVDEILN